MNEEHTKKLLEILNPLFEEYAEVRITKENGKLMIYGVNYGEMCDLKFEGDDNG